ncbi:MULTISPECIES: GNAT family N-acetyltransferase [Frankia]|uniref:GNAT family N-acetyltransferase n=1 Tax=Frankia TaxID=1854 RepID=UPI0003002381|nr:MULTISPECIES: GNAT family N-acetyltransferase [Frankia]OFB38895.1 hypothetical protein Manayef4_21210 [Frankia sp. CgIM4]OHV49046.1 hypothetical protein CgIS1_21540 [Frankia sp. CgIS1]ORT47050.1 hypothetical protein KBI5_21920 [Frankia sp. KB5]ORT93728.1 hypothetical protein UK99_18520 [Frankia casuarinae]
MGDRRKHGRRRPDPPRGVGETLITHVLDTARAANCYKVQLLSRNDRSEVHAFYAAVGFTHSAAGFRIYLT